VTSVSATYHGNILQGFNIQIGRYNPLEYMYQQLYRQAGDMSALQINGRKMMMTGVWYMH
jgi:hypothetical protein